MSVRWCGEASAVIAHAARLGLGDRLDGLARAQVLDVDAPVLVAGERGVAGDHRRLGDRRDAGQAEPRATPRPRASRRRPTATGPPRAGASTPPHRRWYWSALRSIPARTTGLPSSVKPSAPASRELGHLRQRVALEPARDRGAGSRPARAPRGGRPRAGCAARARSRPSGPCWASPRRRRSRRPRPRGCPSRGPPCAPGRACAGARAGRRSPGTGGGPRRRGPRRRRARSRLPGSPSSAISPPRTSTSRAASIPSRGSSTWAPRTSRSAGGGGVVVERGHASCGAVGAVAGVGAARPASSS